MQDFLDCFEGDTLVQTSELVAPIQQKRVDEMTDDDAQITIDRMEMGTGWVCFQAGETPPPREELPAYLDQTFCSWLQRNPEFKVQTVLPIVECGNTVAIHVWFE